MCLFVYNLAQVLLADEISGAGPAESTGESGEFIEALLVLSKDDALRATIGAVARPRAEYHWDRTAVVANLAQQLREARMNKIASA